MLAVRAMAGQTAWLDGQIRWHEGRVVWQSDGRLVAPEPADLALAQRRLRQIGGSPEAARRTLGDLEAWLARRRARLELAKRLAPLRAPDLPDLAERARARDPDASVRLADLLLAEALCTNDLPASPSAALAAAGQAAVPRLVERLQDESEPLAGRALAALTLGAIHGRVASSETTREPASVARAPWLKRAYRYGAASGLSAEPALTAWLLSEEDGPALARRCSQTLLSDSPFRLSADVLRELLARGIPASRVVSLAEAALAADSLADRIRQERGDLPAVGPERRGAAEQLRRQQTETLAELGAVFTDYGRSAAEPLVLERMARLGHAFLDFGGSQPTTMAAVLRAFRTGLDLPAQLQSAYLGTLATYRDHIWTSNGVAGSVADDASFARWLDQTHEEWVDPIASLLAKTRDPELTHKCIELGVVPMLHACEWEDAGLYRVFVRLAGDLGLTRNNYSAWRLPSALTTLRDESASLTALRPVVEVLRNLESDLRFELLEAVAVAAPTTRRELLERLPQLARRLPAVARYLGGRSRESCDQCVAWPLVAGVLELDRLGPDWSNACLDWILARIAALEADPAALQKSLAHLKQAVRLAAGLASDLDGFQRVAGAVMHHQLGGRVDLAERGLSALGRLPRTRAALVHLLPLQPGRCMDLLERIGLAARLGAAALAPIDDLEPHPGAATQPARSFPEEWARLLETAPGLEEGAESYLAARRLTGSPLHVPSGVARALAQPIKLRDELAYLERSLAAQPNRSDLAKRVANLRARLSDADNLLDGARQEAAERLEQHTAEAWLAASEQQVLACYRARLAAVVGRVTENLGLDDDLLNATLLTVDITLNRRLLLRLLRARLARDGDWVRRQPANAAFLAELARHEIDPATWLGRHPRSYRCSAVLGGRVRLRLETDPLRILQMGNYFDTCLSFGGANAFSTVANACDLNKRVIYATDAAGRVVGRKLIALNDELDLVGFRTYSSLTDEAGNQALRAIFRRYCGDFAERCGLRLADEGPVPTLVARHWYDDGVVRWDDAADPPEFGTHAHSAHIPVSTQVGAI